MHVFTANLLEPDLRVTSHHARYGTQRVNVCLIHILVEKRARSILFGEWVNAK